MSKEANLCDLKVVAYSGSLTEQMVPTTVAPIFQNKNTGEYVYPPFRIEDGIVKGASFSFDEREFKEFSEREEITLMKENPDAKENHDIWIDQDMNAFYQPSQEVRDLLDKMAYNFMVRADVFLRVGNLKWADKYVGKSMCAKENQLDCYAMRAAIREKEGKSTAAKVMRKLCPSKFSEEDFQTKKNNFFKMIPDKIIQ